MQKIEPKFTRRIAAPTTITTVTSEDTTQEPLKQQRQGSPAPTEARAGGVVALSSSSVPPSHHDLASEDWEAFTRQEKEDELSVTDSDTEDSTTAGDGLEEERSRTKKKRETTTPTATTTTTTTLKQTPALLPSIPRASQITLQPRASSLSPRTSSYGKDFKGPIRQKESDIKIGLADGYRYELSGSFKPHTDFVRCVKFLNRSNRYFYSGSNDGTVAVYDLELQKVILCFRAHKEKTGLTDVSWSNNNKFILTSSLIERSIKIWNYETKKKVSSITIGSGVTAACFNPLKSNHIVCGDMEGHLYWYNIQTLESKEIYRDYSIFENNSDFVAPFTSLAYGVKARAQQQQKKTCWLFSGNSSGRLEVFKFLQHKDQYKYLKHISQKHSITHIVFSERHEVIIVNSADDKLKMYSIPQLDLEAKIVITGSEDGQFRIFDVDSGVLINTIQASNLVTPANTTNTTTTTSTTTTTNHSTQNNSNSNSNSNSSKSTSSNNSNNNSNSNNSNSNSTSINNSNSNSSNSSDSSNSNNSINSNQNGSVRSVICCVDVSPSGVIVSASTDGEVRLWTTHNTDT